MVATGCDDASTTAAVQDALWGSIAITTRSGVFDIADTYVSSPRFRNGKRVLRVTEGDDDGVIGIECDRVMKTAPLGVVSGAVVVVLAGLSSR
jgi:hypothetical protein